MIPPYILAFVTNECVKVMFGPLCNLLTGLVVLCLCIQLY